MLKHLIIIISILLSSCASNNSKESSSSSLTVRVIGIGSSFESAQENGLRNAVQQVFGAIVISERELSNDNLSDNNISYSKGMVETFQVSNFFINPKDKQFNLQMIVTVSPAAMGKRILYSSNSSKVDGNTISEKIRAAKIQAASEINRFNQAKVLFDHIAFELPMSIYDTKIIATNVKRNGTEISTEVDIRLTPNESVLKSLCEVGQSYHFAMLPQFRPHTQNQNNTVRWLQTDCKNSFSRHLAIELPGGAVDHFSMTDNDWFKLRNQFEDTRVCLSILDSNNIEFSKILIDTKLINRFISRAIYYGSGVESLTLSNNQESIKIYSSNLLSVDNSLKIRATLPKSLENISQRIASIQARVVNKNSCVSSSALILRSDGKLIP